jgi:hypothetical protein
MRKNTQSQSAYFNPRVFASFLLCSAAAWMAMLSFASTPSSGTLSTVTPVLTYDAGPLVINQSPLGAGLLDKGPRCDTEFPCDSYALTITLPAGYVAANPGAAAKVSLFWTNTDPTNNSPSDYDLYVYKGVVGTLNGSQQADWFSAGPPSSNPEVANITPLTDGTSQYTIKIVGFQPTGETVHVRIELVSGSSGGGFPGFGQADPTTPGVPRYQIFDNTTADAGQNNGQGEFNIGYNNTTKRIMAYNGLQADIYRVTPAEIATPGKPECCAETWTQKPATSTGIVGLDPILWTDNWTDPNPLPMQPASGARTFVSNSTVGTNAAYAATDDDGDSYVLPTGASPPNASSDHETIGSGVYPAALSALGNAVNHGHAVYYCAQTFPVGGAACQRSDFYGASYGPSVPVYTGQAGSLCGGIHGHVHVGPDGTVYLPVRDCTGNAGLAVSPDGGTTWTLHAVPNSPTQVHGSDPSIAIGANNTVYIFYITGNPDNTEGHVHVQVSTDHGANWSKDTDLGISHGVINSAFPEAVAGDGDRAACGFLGTDRPGFYEGQSFVGYWYLFIATTYDGGNTWNVVNVTPNDPVQGKGGIWQGGGSGILNRNLLDFNEVTMDEKGRVLFGYSDGCTGTCVGNPDNNTFRAAMRVARQIGGKSLLSAYDVAEPAVPKAPCLSGIRNSSGVHLTWKAPDNGGADIVSYNIYRGTASGNETFLINTGNTKLTFADITADPSQAVYYYVKAVNSVSAAGGTQSQEVNFPATPGIQLLSITSQKTHGTAGTFGINLPLDGSAIECRTVGALPGGAVGDYQLVYDFANSVSSVTNAAVVAGTGTVAGASVQGGNYVVNLSGVTNAQRIVVRLSGVTDSAGNALASLDVIMGVLLGDVNATRGVDGNDVSAVQAHTRQNASATTFRFDVNTTGGIDGNDVSLTQSKTRTSLP